MLDIKLITKNPDFYINSLKNRHDNSEALITKCIELDSQRRAAETDLQQLQQQRNQGAKQVQQQLANGEDVTAVKANLKQLGTDIKTKNQQIEDLRATVKDVLLRIPNVPHAACPLGRDESANPVLRYWGEKPSINEPLNHLEIAEKKQLISLEKGAKITGSGYAVYQGIGAKLERALTNFLLDIHTTEHGYQEYQVPHIVQRKCMEGTGQLPKFEEDMYGLEQNELFLIPTAEVPVTNLYRESILDAEQLPIKMTAHTPCFRREAGSAGKVNRGIIRMHQFNKVELVHIVHPAQSQQALEQLTANVEKVLQLLGLHYRVIELCSGDLGFSAAQTYDIEVWAPGQNSYLEVSSCSNFQDYQARRMQLRFKDKENKKNSFCHTLNGSGTALPRLYVALLEQCQQVDGSIKIPPALVPYFGKEVIA